jgi:hypothetical protein
MKLRLLAIKSGRISEMVTMDNTFLTSEIYDQDEEIYNVSLDWMTQSEELIGEEITLHQNRPNPWDAETIIPFEIPEAGDVTLTVTNSLGVEIMDQTREFTAGKQQFKITNDSWPQGLYYYTIRFGDTQLTKTMLILNKH